MSMGSEIGVNTYFIEMKHKINGMKMIRPINDYLNNTVNEGDNKGLWPMYIYNYGLNCSDITYTIFLHTVTDREGNHPIW